MKKEHCKNVNIMLFLSKVTPKRTFDGTVILVFKDKLLYIKLCHSFSVSRLKC